MVILPKICAQLRPLLGFRWEMASTSKLEAAYSIAVQGIGSWRRKQVSAKVVASIFAKKKKHVPRQYQYFQKMSFTVLRNRMKWSQLQQYGCRPESQLDEDLSGAKSEFAKESLAVYLQTIQSFTRRSTWNLRSWLSLPSWRCCWRDLIQLELELELS